MNTLNMPGFTAEISLCQTKNHYRLAAGGSFLNNGKTTVARRALLDAQSAVVPAQIGVSRLLALRGGVRRLWEERPVCPLGQQAVWVERELTEKWCKTKRPFFNYSTMRWEFETVEYQCGWEQGFTGWECQSAFRVAA
jgi:hypothetical protein